MMFARALQRGLVTSTPRRSTNQTNTTIAQMMTTRRWMASDMPVPQSQNAPLWHGHKVAKEGWEESIYFYYIVGFLMQAAIVFGAPETSIESWARAEAQARLRLAAQGQTEFEFGQHYQDLEKQASLEVWNKFANQSVIPGDDDDDEEEEVRTARNTPQKDLPHTQIPHSFSWWVSLVTILLL